MNSFQYGCIIVIVSIMQLNTFANGKNTDCSNQLTLQCQDSIDEFCHDIKKFIGVYRLQEGYKGYDGHDIYLILNDDSVSYLFYRQGHGWRINEKPTSNPNVTPGIVLQSCTDQCPEACINEGQWKIRNTVGWPKSDKSSRLQWKQDITTTSTSTTTLTSKTAEIKLKLRRAEFLIQAETTTPIIFTKTEKVPVITSPTTVSIGTRKKLEIETNNIKSKEKENLPSENVITSGLNAEAKNVHPIENKLSLNPVNINVMVLVGVSIGFIVVAAIVIIIVLLIHFNNKIKKITKNSKEQDQESSINTQESTPSKRDNTEIHVKEPNNKKISIVGDVDQITKIFRLESPGDSNSSNADAETLSESHPIDTKTLHYVLNEGGKGMVQCEDWNIVKNIVNPHKLTDLGNPSIFTIASCLGLLTEFENRAAKTENEETKHRQLLDLWKGRQKNNHHPVTNFINALKERQEATGCTELNLMIGELEKSNKLQDCRERLKM